MGISGIARHDILISILTGVCCWFLSLFMMMLTGSAWMDAQVAWADGNKVNWGALPYLHGLGLALLVAALAGVLTVMLSSGQARGGLRTATLGGIAGFALAVAPWNPTWGIFLAIETGTGSYMELYQLYILSVLAGLIVIVPLAAASAYCYGRLDLDRLSRWFNKKIV